MELLYEKYYRQLYLYALTYLSDDDDAKDVVSDMFTTLWQHWADDDGEIQPPPASYLYRTLRSRCVDKLRRDGVHSRYAQQLEADVFDNETDVKEYERQVQCLVEAIDNLPEPGKTILKNCYFDQLTYQQTAERLGLTLVVVRKHMLKMFRLLRDVLKKINKRYNFTP